MITIFPLTDNKPKSLKGCHHLKNFSSFSILTL